MTEATWHAFNSKQSTRFETVHQSQCQHGSGAQLHRHSEQLASPLLLQGHIPLPLPRTAFIRYFIVHFYNTAGRKNGRLSWWLRRQRICLQCRRPGFDPWVNKVPWRREWQPTLVFLPGEIHAQRSLVGYSPWGHKTWDMTQQLSLSLHFRGNGNIEKLKCKSNIPSGQGKSICFKKKTLKTTNLKSEATSQQNLLNNRFIVYEQRSYYDEYQALL